MITYKDGNGKYTFNTNAKKLPTQCNEILGSQIKVQIDDALNVKWQESPMKRKNETVALPLPHQ